VSTARDDTAAESIAALVRRYRVAAGLSQEALAEQAGLSARGLSDLERGLSRTPRLHTLARLADALGLAGAERAALLTHSQWAGPTPSGAAGGPQAPSSNDAAGVVPSTSLPLQRTSFVGREAQVAELEHRLSETRLLTLAGAGGVGKTRLALATAVAAGAQFADGLVFVNLAPLSDPTLVEQHVAAAFGLREQPATSLRQELVSRIGSSHLLLVLDNCEHVIEVCAGLIDHLLQQCARLQILATSREPLGLAGELIWRVPSLRLPDLAQPTDTQRLGQVGSVRLFVDRARAVQPSFELTPHNARAVADVCVRLDGLPLAIELAAARVTMLTPQQLLERLAEPFQVLTRGSRTAAPRHQTLRATLDWSYGLLEEAERRLLARLSVFAGGWSLESAERVCAGETIATDQVLDLLAQLVDKSLVSSSQDTDPVRYRLLEPVRQYAAERLAELGETETLRDRHRTWCMWLVDQAKPEWFGPRQRACLERLELEHDNLRAALAWSVRSGRDARLSLRLGSGLWRFWDMRAYLSEGSDYLKGLLSLSSSSDGGSPLVRARAQALEVAGYLATLRGAHAEALGYLEESVRLWHIDEDRRGLAAALFHLGLATMWSQPQPEPAELLLGESLGLARASGPQWVTYFSLMRLGDLARLRGDLARAETLLGESRELCESAGDGWALARCLHSLGLVRLARGDGESATRVLDESVALSSALQDPRGVAAGLDGLACVAAAAGHAEHAAQLFGRAAALRESTGDVVSAAVEAERERGLEAARARLGAAAFEQAWACGRTLSIERVLHAADAGGSPAAPPTRRSAPP